MAGVMQDGLPEGCHHYELYDQVPAEIEKYAFFISVRAKL